MGDQQQQHPISTVLTEIGYSIQAWIPGGITIRHLGRYGIKGTRWIAGTREVSENIEVAPPTMPCWIAIRSIWDERSAGLNFSDQEAFVSSLNEDDELPEGCRVQILSLEEFSFISKSHLVPLGVEYPPKGFCLRLWNSCFKSDHLVVCNDQISGVHINVRADDEEKKDLGIAAAIRILELK